MEARFIGVFSLLILSVTGCGGSNPVPIQPRVLLDGEPLTQASISFFREDSEQGRAAFGRTDGQGVATLTTFKPGDGVLPGSYRIVVVKAPENPNTYMMDNSVTQQPDAKMMLQASSMAAQAPSGPRMRRVRTVIDEVYSDPGSTPLRGVVDSSTREFDIELTSSP